MTLLILTLVPTRNLESTPIKKDSLRFYNTPQQDALLALKDKKPAPALQNKQAYWSSSAKHDGAANTKVQQTSVEPETVTSL